MAAESKPADCAAVRKDTTAAGDDPAADKPIAIGIAPQEQSGVARPKMEAKKVNVNRLNRVGCVLLLNVK